MIPDAWYQQHATTCCEVLTCRHDATHILHIDNDDIRLCEYHIGRMILPCMSLQCTGSTVSVHKIERSQSWQAEQERLRYEGE